MPAKRHRANADVPMRPPAEPKQARSRRTRERIFAAAEQLPRDRDVPALTRNDLAVVCTAQNRIVHGEMAGIPLRLPRRRPIDQPTAMLLACLQNEPEPR